MPTAYYILIGNIKHPGKVLVEAESAEEAIKKAEAGHFEIWDEEAYDCLEFEFCGDKKSGAELYHKSKGVYYG